MKIALLGYMGSGKSAIGKELAKQLNIPFIDLDDYIENEEGKTISNIFSENGEIYFRKKEGECLHTLLSEVTDCILSVGGGTPCYGTNMDTILNNTHSIYLQASINTLATRLIGEMQSRPIVASLNSDELNTFIAKHLFERRAYYERAQHIVSVDGKEIKGIVSEIEQLFQ